MAKKRTKGSFRSVAERDFASLLDSQGIPFEYEKEFLEYIIPIKPHKYIPDFKVGSLYIEFKGYLKTADRKKMLLVIDQHPDKDIRFVFMKDNKLYKDSPTRYSDWCEKNNIKYHIGAEIPPEWIKEAFKKPKKKKGK